MTVYMFDCPSCEGSLRVAPAPPPLPRPFPEERSDLRPPGSGLVIHHAYPLCTWWAGQGAAWICGVLTGQLDPTAPLPPPVRP